MRLSRFAIVFVAAVLLLAFWDPLWTALRQSEFFHRSLRSVSPIDVIVAAAVLFIVLRALASRVK